METDNEHHNLLPSVGARGSHNPRCYRQVAVYESEVHGSCDMK